MNKPHLMYFRDQIFYKDKPNITIRKGEKWRDLLPGDEIYLMETGTGAEIGKASVKEIMVSKYNEIPETISKKNQESPFEMYEDFNENDDVVVVFFELVA